MQEVILDAGESFRRRRELEESAAAVVFMTIPPDVMHAICLFLRLKVLFRFLGETCRSIRERYFRLSEIFTEARPMHMPLDIELRYTMMVPSMQALARRALPGAKAIPVHARLNSIGERMRYMPVAWDNPWALKLRAQRVPLFSIHYEVRKSGAHTVENMSALLRALRRRREWRHVRCIDISFVVDSMHKLPHRILQQRFTSVKRIRIQIAVDDAQFNHVDLLERLFPCATLYLPGASWPDTLDSLEMEYRVSLLDKAEFKTVVFRGAASLATLEAYRKCMHRTIKVFIVSTETSPVWRGVIASELENRIARRRPYRVDSHLCFKDDISALNASLITPFGKYIAELLVNQTVCDDTGFNWTGLVSVRRFSITLPREAEMTEIATPPSVALERARWQSKCNITVASGRPLRPVDMAYLFRVLSWVTSSAMKDMKARGDAVVFSTALEAFRRAYVADYDHAFRVYYEFIPQDNAIPPIRGYV